MAKAEVSWKRVREDGQKIQCYAHHVSKQWRFFSRVKRFDEWQAVKDPPLEDWLELLDAVQRLVTRRRYQPDDEERIKASIRARFPDAEV